MNIRDEMDLWADEFREKAKSVKESRALQVALGFAAAFIMAVAYLAIEAQH